MGEDKLKSFTVADTESKFRGEVATSSEPRMEPPTFPFIEEMFKSGRLPDLLRQCEQTCEKLNAVIESGSEAEIPQARAAMAAYGRALDLLGELSELAEKEQQK